MGKSTHTVSVGPFPGTSLVGSVYKHGKRTGKITEIPFTFLRADDKAGMLAILENKGAAWVIERYNYGATLKEQAAVTPGAESDKAPQRRLVESWIRDGADGADRKTPAEYLNMLNELSKMGPKVLNPWLDVIFKDENLEIADAE